MSLQTVFGQPSTRIATGEVEAWVTALGGHVGPITFRHGDRNICPMHVAPWADESWAATAVEDLEAPQPLRGLTASMKSLRGDFFCMPFGGNGVPFEGEQYPLHGETANRVWNLLDGDDNSARFAFDARVRAGRVEKEIRLVPGHLVVYSRHTISAMSGPMTIAHHAMLRCQTRGLVSVAPFQFGITFPDDFESPLGGGYSALAAGATFDDLARVPARDGGFADLSVYPARCGYEDFVAMYAAADVRLGWSAVVFPEEGYVWFTLKDARVLTGTAFWLSNGGRHYHPWNGRHVNCLGIEELISSPATGLADSIGQNPAAQAGCRTHLVLDPDVPTVVNTLFGIAPIPAGFDHVATIDATSSGIRLTSRSGAVTEAAVDLGHLALD